MRTKLLRPGGLAFGRTMHGERPVMCRIYNPALGKWLSAEAEDGRAEDGGAGGALTVAWTGNRDEAMVAESHSAEALAEALVGMSRQFGLGWHMVHSERAGR